MLRRYDYDHGEDGLAPDAPDWYCRLFQRELAAGASVDWLAGAGGSGSSSEEEGSGSEGEGSGSEGEGSGSEEGASGNEKGR